MANSWISFVKDFADKKKMKYTEAMKSQECKDAYKSEKPKSNDDMKKEMNNMVVKVQRKKKTVESIEPSIEMIEPIKIKKVRAKKAMKE